MPKIIQITASSTPSVTGGKLFALDNEGSVWLLSTPNPREEPSWVKVPQIPFPKKTTNKVKPN